MSGRGRSFFSLLPLALLVLAAVSALAARGVLARPLPEPAGPTAGPVLAVPDYTTATAGQPVVVPLAFSNGGHAIDTIFFVLSYDATLLTLDATDANDDGIPDSIAPTLPDGYRLIPSIDIVGGEGRFQALIYPSSGSAPLPNGDLATLTFDVPWRPTPVPTYLDFLASPAPFFANTDDEVVPGNFAGGMIDISQIPTLTPTPSRTPTPTISPTPSATATATATASPTPSPTATATLSPTASLTPTATTSPTITQTPSATPTPSTTPTATATASPTATATTSPTASITPTPSRTPTPAPVYLPALLFGASPTPTATATKVATATMTATATTAATATTTATATAIATATQTPTLTATTTPTSTPTATASATATATATPSATATATTTAAPTTTGTPTLTPTPSRTPAPIYLPALLFGASPTPTATATASPTATPTATGTATPTRPPTKTPTVTPTRPTSTPTPTATRPPDRCTDLIVNGGFEDNDGWQINANAFPARYVISPVYSGLRAMQIGIVRPQDNVYSYSSIQQTLFIPAGPPSVALSFQLFATTTGTRAAALTPPPVVPTSPLDRAKLSDDVQMVLLFDSSGQQHVLLFQRQWYSQWQRHVIDLSAFRGQAVTLYFGVFNNGAGGITGMAVDDVAVTYCLP